MRPLEGHRVRHPTQETELDLRPYEKGVPGGSKSVALADVPLQRWNVLGEDLPLPVAVLKRDALDANRRRMQAFLHTTGAHLAPHGKTTMCPELFDMQLADGAWGITVATPHHIQVARYFGYRRVFLANQLVGKNALDYVVSELNSDPSFEFYCLVDSVEGVRQLASAARRGNLARPIPLLVELGYAGGRTGCRSIEEALKVAREAASNAGVLVLCGVEGFEGFLRGGEGESTQQLIERFLEDMGSLARDCDASGLFGVDEVLLSAGGTSHYDLVVRNLSSVRLSRRTTVLLRSGCYLTHDSGMYVRAAELRKQRSPDLEDLGHEFEAALEVWAYVQSRPEAGLAIVGLGKRDVSYDELPVPLYWSHPGAGELRPREFQVAHRVLRLNDQHAYLEVPPDTPLSVGDMVAFGISHPCLTFDKWRVLHIVDDAYNVVASIRSYF